MSWGQRSKFSRFIHKWKDEILAFATILIAIGTGLQVYVLLQTDKTTRLRDRAFIYFSEPQFVPYPRDKPRVWGVTLVLTNAGNMPARQVAVAYDCPSFPVEVRNGRDPFELSAWNPLHISNVIGPKQTFGVQSCNIPIEWINETRAGKRETFITMFVRYLDGFELDERKVTQMSRTLLFDQDGGESLGVIGEHNCSDYDCRH